MKSFGKLLLADLRQFYRDRTALFFTFLFPLLFMLIFGAAFGGSQNVSYDIGLVDNDNSPVSGQIDNILNQVPILKITQSGNLDQELADLKNGKLGAVISIPAGTGAAVAAKQTSKVTVYYDPSQTTSSSVILSSLNQIIDGINQQLTGQPAFLQLTQESVATHNLRYIDYLVPGILAMSILFLGLFGSLALVERREKKILKRFGATPISRSRLLMSQVIYRLVLAVVQALIIIAIASLIFKVSVLGNWLELFGLVLLGTMAFISIGYFAVSRARTVEGAMPIIQLVQFPMLFLSGIFFPVELMPAFMRPIINAMPLTYLGDAFRQIMVDATPLHPLGLDVLVLVAWLVVCVGLAIRLFRWE